LLQIAPFFGDSQQRIEAWNTEGLQSNATARMNDGYIEERLARVGRWRYKQVPS